MVRGLPRRKEREAGESRLTSSFFVTLATSTSSKADLTPPVCSCSFEWSDMLVRRAISSGWRCACDR